MTGAEFLTYVRNVLMRTDKDTVIYEAATDIIVDIKLQIKSEDFKEEAFSAGISTLGNYRIALPVDFGHIIGQLTLVDDSNSFTRTLRKISKQRYDELYGDRLFNNVNHIIDGTPVHFCIYAKQIFIGPVPDKTSFKYFLNYTTEAFEKIDGSTNPVPFTDKYRNILRAGVLAEVYEGLDAFDESGYWRQKFMEGLYKIKTNEDETTTGQDAVQYHGI